MAEFTDNPLKSFVLACLMVAMGVLAVSGWIPTSINRVYFPGHEWVLGAVCWAAALYFLFCAVRGGKRKK